MILASASPRRRELLRRICPDFTVEASDVDEALGAGPVAPAVAALALRKARAVARRAGPGLVLAADTVVVLDGEVLGKPAGPEEARAMLRRLRGRAHEVLTGVAVVDAASGRAASATERTRVLMAHYSDATIEAYVASGAPLDKAGAYGIQGWGGIFVPRIEGDYFNVMGLPLAALRRLCLGVDPPESGGADR
ncbi:MAG TPA: hypothetical protein DDZ42_12195 [Candidatus Rokubacteria bacterium]|nr:hypothetical protein [Candidatus Rokubacteria bacterium]